MSSGAQVCCLDDSFFAMGLLTADDVKTLQATAAHGQDPT